MDKCNCQPTRKAPQHGDRFTCDHGRRWIYTVSTKYGDAWDEILSAESLTRV